MICDVSLAGSDMVWSVHPPPAVKGKARLCPSKALETLKFNYPIQTSTLKNPYTPRSASVVAESRANPKSRRFEDIRDRCWKPLQTSPILPNHFKAQR